MATSDFKIEQVNSWRHKDAAFIVQLGHACGWMIRERDSGVIQMYAQDGTQVTVPNNTSLNIGVFRSWVSKVWRHRRTTVSPKAFEELVGQSKLDRPHVQIAWQATNLNPPTPLPEITDQETAAAVVAAVVDSALVEEAEASVALDGQTQSIEAVAADYKDHGTVVSHEPNSYKKNATSATMTVSETVMRRTWSDGYFDFTCADCGHVSASPSGIGGHRVKHGPYVGAGGRGRAKAAAEDRAEVLTDKEQRRKDKDAERKRKDRERKRAEYVPAKLRDKLDELKSGALPPPGAPGTPDARLAEIARLVFPSMITEMDAMQTQLAEAIARAEKAEGDLDALRDLLGVKR